MTEEKIFVKNKSNEFDKKNLDETITYNIRANDQVTIRVILLNNYNLGATFSTRLKKKHGFIH